VGCCLSYWGFYSYLIHLISCASFVLLVNCYSYWEEFEILLEKLSSGHKLLGVES
jgi:hypothetical protein